MNVQEYFLIPQEKVELLNFEYCRGKSKEAENESEKIIDKNTKELFKNKLKKKYIRRSLLKRKKN